MACLRASRFRRMLDNALLELIGLLAAEEVGKTWLSKLRHNVSLGNMMVNDVTAYRFHQVSSSSTS